MQTNAKSAPATKPTKQSKADRKAAAAAILAKRAAPQPEPSKALTVTAKPEPAPEANDKLTQRRAERAYAANAVATFYNGASLPFKSASDRFADLRTDKASKAPTVRQAALLAAMLLSDTADNIKSDGTFTRGGFRVFAKPNTAGKLQLARENESGAFPIFAQPESGALSDGIGRLYSYVSGPLSGNAAKTATFRINAKAAHAELCLLPAAISAPARARLATLMPA